MLKCIIFVTEVQDNDNKEDIISDEESDNDSNSTSVISGHNYGVKKSSFACIDMQKHNYGSFYLRMGAVGKKKVFLRNLKKLIFYFLFQLLVLAA